MTCADLEILLCDYVDGTLGREQRMEVEAHMSSCAACAELARDASGAVAFVERVAVVEPPPELMTRILFEIRGGKMEPVRKPSGARRFLGGIFGPILQPRFVMGMAMTILSFSMLERFAGVGVRQLKVSDLEPGKVWISAEHKVNRGWLAVVKYYESLRFVYEVQSRLREWSDQDDEAAVKDAAAAPSPRIIDPNDTRLRESAPAVGSTDKATERPKQ